VKCANIHGKHDVREGFTHEERGPYVARDTNSSPVAWNTQKKKKKEGVPRHTATMVLPKKERKESPGDAEETVLMAFTQLP